MEEATIQTIDVNGASLSVKEAGTGKGMVLIHGRLGSKEVMEDFFQHYHHAYHVASYDVRGHGLSTKPEHMTLDECAADLLALMDALGMEKPIIVGFSMGSYIALRFAELYPEKAGRLVLIGTRGIRSAKDVRDVSGMFAPQTTPEQIDAFHEKARSAHIITPEEEAVINEMIEEFDLLWDAGKVTAPVLLMTGEHDSLNTTEDARNVAEALKDAHFEIIPNAGHIAFFENPERVFELLNDFIK